jgi:hypothetical protein
MIRAVQESKEKGNIGPRLASCGKENGGKKGNWASWALGPRRFKSFSKFLSISYFKSILNSNGL